MRPPEKVRNEVTRRWLELALKDLDVGKLLQRKGRKYWDFALFHFQQSVQKAIKGFLVGNDRSFKKIHSLGTLGGLCVSIDPTLEESLRAVDVLSKYAVDARYPGEMLEQLTVRDVKEGLKIAETIFAEILKRIPLEVYPAKKTRSRRQSKGGEAQRKNASPQKANRSYGFQHLLKQWALARLKPLIIFSNVAVDPNWSRRPGPAGFPGALCKR